MYVSADTLFSPSRVPPEDTLPLLDIPKEEDKTGSSPPSIKSNRSFRPSFRPPYEIFTPRFFSRFERNDRASFEGGTRAFEEGEIFFSFLRKVIKGIWAKMCETVCKRDKGGTIKSVEFGGIVDDVDIWIYCGFRAGSGVYYLRIDGPANIRTRMLSVTINASANMAFTEQNLDIGHLCEIDPINSNLHALLFIRYECWWSRRTWDHRLNGTW